MTSVEAEQKMPSPGEEQSFLQVKQLLEKTKNLGKLRIIGKQ